MLSIPYTVSPRSSNLRASAEPINPAAPVIRIFIVNRYPLVVNRKLRAENTGSFQRPDEAGNKHSDSGDILLQRLQMIFFTDSDNPGYLNVSIQLACRTKSDIKKLPELLVSISRGA